MAFWSAGPPEESPPSNDARIGQGWPAAPARAGGSRAAGFRAAPGGRTGIVGPLLDGVEARLANIQGLRRKTYPNPIADGPKALARARSAGPECYGCAGFG